MKQQHMGENLDSSFDVFKIDEESPNPASPVPAMEATKTSTKQAGWADRIGLRNLALVAAGAIGCVWAVWPSDSPNERTRSMPLPPVVRPAQSSIPAPLPSEIVPDTLPQAKPDLVTQAQFEDAAKAQSLMVSELATRVQALEAREAATKEAARARPVSTQGARSASAPRKPVHVLEEYAINTVYPDQAWIEKAGKLSVVQVGDTFDGMRVVRIDPATRIVVTSQGLIR